jgi:hypothetical protein
VGVSPAVVQIIEVGVALATPTILFGLILNVGRILDGIGWLAQRVGLIPKPPLCPRDPPIEKVAASLRRIDREVLALPQGTPQTRRRALQLAYDDLLAAACRALAVPYLLDRVPPGWGRDVERVRVEASLEQAGLCIRDRRRGEAA